MSNQPNEVLDDACTALKSSVAAVLEALKLAHGGTENSAAATAAGADEDEDDGEEAEEVRNPRDFFNMVEDHGLMFIDLRRVKDRSLQNYVWDALTDKESSHSVRDYGHVYPVGYVARHHDYFSLYFQRRNIDTADVVELMAILAQEVEVNNRIYLSRLESGQIEMADLERHFAKGSHVVLDGDVMVAGVLKSIKTAQTQRGPVMSIELEVVHAMEGEATIGTYNVQMRGFNGVQNLATLPIRMMSDDNQRALVKRGSLFRQFHKAGSFLSYIGTVVQPHWYGDRCYRADGRIIIDPISFKRIEENTWRSVLEDSGIETGEQDGEHKSTIKGMESVDDSDLWRCMPYLYGFSFAAKVWGRINIENLRPVEWRTNAYDMLVLPEEDKEEVKAMVEFNGTEGNSDIIDGKGGGCVFLLHGETGQGKTATAEAVAEQLKKPLYSISVGELGTDPGMLEGSLRSIMDVAMIWDAVILLDEADIFLEARDQTDIARNAMVGVFLRLLDYHPGVLFLTTNRVQNIDKAFLSRISYGIRFPEADHEKRVKVWRNQLVTANLSPEWAEELGEYKLNGRQVRNAIARARTRARSQGRVVDYSDIQRSAHRALEFTKDMSDLSQPVEDRTGR